MTDIKHQAFLDLEQSLADKLVTLWRRNWRLYADAIQKAIDDGDFEAARRTAGHVSLANIAERAEQHARTIGMAAALLGASRHGDVQKSVVLRCPPYDEIRAGASQLGIMLTNASDDLRGRVLAWIATEELAALTLAKLDRPDFHTEISVAGEKYLGIASSVQVSRMSAFGFLAQAAEQGRTAYEISAILDDHTCEVCRHMDGRAFSVDAGLQLAANIMQADSTEAVKQIAPFYAQNKASLKALSSLGHDDLVERGMILPPFHPLCRCIIVPTSAPPMAHFADEANRIQLASAALYGEGEGARLTRELFGIRTPAEPMAPPQSDGKVLEALQELLTRPKAAPKTNEQWLQQAVARWQRLADVPRGTPEPVDPFEGTTLPTALAEPFDPKKLARAAVRRWPWLAAIFGWLATRNDDEPKEVAPDDEIDDEEPA